MNVFESIMTGLTEAAEFENGNTDVKPTVLTADPIDSITDDND